MCNNQQNSNNSLEHSTLEVANKITALARLFPELNGVGSLKTAPDPNGEGFVATMYIAIQEEVWVQEADSIPYTARHPVQSVAIVEALTQIVEAHRSLFKNIFDYDQNLLEQWRFSQHLSYLRQQPHIFGDWSAAAYLKRAVSIIRRNAPQILIEKDFYVGELRLVRDKYGYTASYLDRVEELVPGWTEPTTVAQLPYTASGKSAAEAVIRASMDFINAHYDYLRHFSSLDWDTLLSFSLAGTELSSNAPYNNNNDYALTPQQRWDWWRGFAPRSAFPRQFAEGQQAFFATQGDPRRAKNPYKEKTYEHLAWRGGWNEAFRRSKQGV